MVQIAAPYTLVAANPSALSAAAAAAATGAWFESHRQGCVRLQLPGAARAMQTAPRFTAACQALVPHSNRSLAIRPAALAVTELPANQTQRQRIPGIHARHPDHARAARAGPLCNPSYTQCPLANQRNASACCTHSTAASAHLAAARSLCFGARNRKRAHQLLGRPSARLISSPATSAAGLAQPSPPRPAPGAQLACGGLPQGRAARQAWAPWVPGQPAAAPPPQCRGSLPVLSTESTTAFRPTPWKASYAALKPSP
jgi:hypothetical protein